VTTINPPIITPKIVNASDMILLPLLFYLNLFKNISD
jgi:hypothetical protein